MKKSKTVQSLYEAMAEFSVIDAHEHLPPEEEYLQSEYSALILFAGYIYHDMSSVGLPQAFKETMRQGGARPVSEWWPVIKPFWEQVKHTSFSKALTITVRDIFGVSDINDSTIEEIAHAVQEANSPGLYHRILQEKCGIETSITCIDRAAFPNDPAFRGITQLEKCTGSPVEIKAELSARSGRPVHTLEEAIEVGQMLLREDIANGALGFKTTVKDHPPLSLTAARTQWEKEPKNRTANAVHGLLFDKYLDVAAEANVPVAVHTGFWGDFRELDPKHMLPWAMRRGDVNFDMFHLGMPMIRDAMVIGKTFPNVTLNLTWCPLISQVQTIRAMDEMVDLVPLTKITAFGGDYRVAVQKVYGHLCLAKEAVAFSLGKRVESGRLDEAEALRIAKLWFYDNPARIYNLDKR